MKLGITGLAGSGKTTVFEALTGEFSEAGNKMENRLGTIRVPNKRIDQLSAIFNPKKNDLRPGGIFSARKISQGKRRRQRRCRMDSGPGCGCPDPCYPEFQNVRS